MYPLGRRFKDLIDPTSARARHDITNDVKTEWKLIGGGSRGDVYEGSMGGLQVAIKFIRIQSADGVKDMERTLRELFVQDYSNGLKHPHIVPLYGLVYSPSRPVPGLVSLFVEHELKNYAADYPEERNRLILQTAEGFAHLHSMSLIHGDIKPSNVRVTSDGQVQIIDFGMGKLENVQGWTTLLSSCPNPRYFAPEFFKEDNEVFRPTYASDVYGFGMLLLEILHGRDLDMSANFDRSMPFNDLQSNAAVKLVRLCVEVGKGHLPLQKRYNLTNSQWDFLTGCWKFVPDERPSMQEVVMGLPNILV